MAGFVVYQGSARTAEEAKSLKEALKVLRSQLGRVCRALPASALHSLRRVPIWLNASQPVPEAIAYHRSAAWLKENGLDPRKARSIEVGNAATFVSWSRQQPSIVLHELAHAYQDHCLDEAAHARIEEAYESARKAGRYDSVLDNQGQRVRAYALTDPWEYFAETTESFFGRNDQYPFTRAQLATHDPRMERLLSELWGVSPRAETLGVR